MGPLCSPGLAFARARLRACLEMWHRAVQNKKEKDYVEIRFARSFFALRKRVAFEK
jgi:hypothetical protein